MPRVAKGYDGEVSEWLSLVGMLIRLHRQRRGLTQKDLAERAGISPYRLSRYEMGRLDPPSTALKQIADAMGIKVHELLRHEAIEV